MKSQRCDPFHCSSRLSYYPSALSQPFLREQKKSQKHQPIDPIQFVYIQNLEPTQICIMKQKPFHTALSSPVKNRDKIFAIK